MARNTIKTEDETKAGSKAADAPVGETAEGYRRSALRFFDFHASMDDQRVSDSVALGITNMGRATACSDEIAKVQVSKGENAVMFRLFLNPARFSEFTAAQRAGVVWHELNHILHDHLSHFADNEGMDDRQRLTVAQEIVCNDTVLAHGNPLPLMDSILHGERILGYNTFPKNTREVYDLLDEEAMDKANQGGEDGEGGGSGGSGGGGGGDADCDECGGSGTDDNGDECQECGGSGKAKGQSGGNSSGHGCGGIEIDPDVTAEDLKDLAESIADGLSEEDMKAISDALGGSGAGHDIPGGNLSLSKKEDVSADWVALLRHIAPEIADEVGGGATMDRMVADWRSQPLFSYGVAGAARLPVFTPEGNVNGIGDDVKPTIILAVDQSGSIPAEVARKARELATTIPAELADVRACVFGDTWAELDLDDGSVSRPHGFGTDFSAVANFVSEVGATERTSVLVFTDGCANFCMGIPHNVTDYWWLEVGGGWGSFEDFIRQATGGAVEDRQIIDKADFIDGL